MKKENFGLFLSEILLIDSSGAIDVYSLNILLNDFIKDTYLYNLILFNELFDLTKLHYLIEKKLPIINIKFLNELSKKYRNKESFEYLVNSTDKKTLYNIIELAKRFVMYCNDQITLYKFQDSCYGLYGKILH